MGASHTWSDIRMVTELCPRQILTKMGGKTAISGCDSTTARMLFFYMVGKNVLRHFRDGQQGMKCIKARHTRSS